MTHRSTSLDVMGSVMGKVRVYMVGYSSPIYYTQITFREVELDFTLHP